MSDVFNIQQLINGIQLGSIYALLALGYTMVYGIIRLINFAHGDFYMVGAYAAYYAVILTIAAGRQTHVLIILVIGMFAGGLVAVLSNKIAYKPLRYKHRLSALITSIGVSMFLEYLFSAVPFIGPSFRAFPEIITQKIYYFNNVTITNYTLIDISIALALMISLSLFIKFTKTGIAMRAVAQDIDAAKLMGVDVEKIITITFLLGGLFAGAVGVLSGITYPRIFPYMGILPGMKAFIAAVLGGIGSIPGAMIGGLIMGISETFASAYKSALGEGISFIILIVVLLLRPQGIIGGKKTEKL